MVSHRESTIFPENENDSSFLGLVFKYIQPVMGVSLLERMLGEDSVEVLMRTDLYSLLKQGRQEEHPNEKILQLYGFLDKAILLTQSFQSRLSTFRTYQIENKSEIRLSEYQFSGSRLEILAQMQAIFEFSLEELAIEKEDGGDNWEEFQEQLKLNIKDDAQLDEMSPVDLSIPGGRVVFRCFVKRSNQKGTHEWSLVVESILKDIDEELKLSETKQLSDEKIAQYRRLLTPETLINSLSQDTTSAFSQTQLVQEWSDQLGTYVLDSLTEPEALELISFLTDYSGYTASDVKELEHFGVEDKSGRFRLCFVRLSGSTVWRVKVILSEQYFSEEKERREQLTKQAIQTLHDQVLSDASPNQPIILGSIRNASRSNETLHPGNLQNFVASRLAMKPYQSLVEFWQENNLDQEALIEIVRSKLEVPTEIWNEIQQMQRTNIYKDFTFMDMKTKRMWRVHVIEKKSEIHFQFSVWGMV